MSTEDSAAEREDGKGKRGKPRTRGRVVRVLLLVASVFGLAGFVVVILVACAAGAAEWLRSRFGRGPQ